MGTGEITADIEKNSKWIFQELKSITHEVAMHPNPTPFFPSLKFEIHGLKSTVSYGMKLHIKRADKLRYKWNSVQNAWFPKKFDKSQTKANEKPKRICCQDGMKLGSEWMKAPIDFSNLKLTSNKNSVDPNEIYLPNLYKYVPVLEVYEYDASNQLEPTLVESIELRDAEFIANSCYNIEAIAERKHLLRNVRTITSGFKTNWKNAGFNIPVTTNTSGSNLPRYAVPPSVPNASPHFRSIQPGPRKRAATTNRGNASKRYKSSGFPFPQPFPILTTANDPNITQYQSIKPPAFSTEPLKDHRTSSKVRNVHPSKSFSIDSILSTPFIPSPAPQNMAQNAFEMFFYFLNLQRFSHPFVPSFMLSSHFVSSAFPQFQQVEQNKGEAGNKDE